jgi:serine protease Do
MVINRVPLQQVAIALIVFVVGCGRGETALAQERQAGSQLEQQTAQVPAVLDTTTAGALSQTFRAAAAKALPSVVTVQVTAQPQTTTRIPFFPFGGQSQEAPVQQGTGSGFVFNAGGHIVTNNHVVENATSVQVTFPDGRVYDNVEVVGRDPNTDVAVLKIEPRPGEELVPMELGNSDALQVGDWVLALGNPLDLGFTVTAGIVSAKGRSLGIIQRTREIGLESFIQTDAAINRGNSGGPLVDLYGRVVGVNTAIYSETGMYAGNGFAVPSDLAAKAANDIIEYGYVRRPRIGVMIQPVEEAEAELYGLDEIRGAYVSEVQDDGPAANAGIEPEDIIVSLNGEPIETSTDLTTRLARMQPGDEVTLGVIRDGRQIDVSMELGQFDTERPETRVAPTDRSAEEMLGIAVADVSELSRQDLATLNLENNEIGGAVVTQVSRYGPASTSLQEGDIILELNRQPVDNVRDLRRLAGDLEEGDVVLLRIRRRSTGNIGVVTFRIR